MRQERRSGQAGMAAVRGPGGGRLRSEDRRRQLLDVAAELLVAHGPQAVTMERLAEHAGVSKALPYRHFDNAADVIAQLYLREVAHLGATVATARQAADSPQDRLRAAVHAYFDVVGERAAILTLLTGAGADRATDVDLGPSFVADLLQADFELAPHRSRLVARVLLGALDGATRAWASGEGRRRELEAAVVAVGLALVSDPSP